jgi:hypothetical protein
MVYNRNDHKVSIAQIQLAGGANSSYRMNVDGNSALNIQNVEIAGKDSIFIFIRVTINPNDKNIAFIVSDSIIFMTNGNRQVVQLTACGQNADFNIKKTIRGNQVWDSLKAHVIYGFLRIDTGAVFTILPGAKIYLHKNAYIAVSDQASLIIGGQGQWDHPVRIQSDRLDTYYRDLPGQWDGIAGVIPSVMLSFRTGITAWSSTHWLQAALPNSHSTEQLFRIWCMMVFMPTQHPLQVKIVS